MFKRKYKKTVSKVVLAVLVVLAFIILSGLIMLTPLGSSIIKSVLESKIDRYIPGVEVTYLDYGVNNFSVAAKKGHNTLKIYGVLFPLNAMYEGDIANVSELTPYFQGRMNLSGKVYIDRNEFAVEGMSFFANGYMNFKTYLNNDNIRLKAEGSEFDLQKLLYMLKIKYPSVSGKTDMSVEKSKGVYTGEFKTAAHYNGRIKTDFTAFTVAKMKCMDNVAFNSQIKSGIGKIFIKGMLNTENWKYEFDAPDINISKLKPLLLYPFKGVVQLKGSYDSSNDIIKFKGRNFTGFYDSRLEANFNMDAKQFFEFMGVEQFLNGNISGTVKINDKSGTFDVVSGGTLFINSGFVRKIYYLTGVNLSKEEMGKVFFKGFFDAKKIVFDLLSTNQNVSISVKKGVFEYPDQYNVILYIRKNNDIYKLKITDKGIKLLEKREFRKQNNKILIF